MVYLLQNNHFIIRSLPVSTLKKPVYFYEVCGVMVSILDCGSNGEGSNPFKPPFSS